MNLILIIERFVQRNVCVIDVNLIVLSICHSIINAGNFRLFIYLFILYQEAYFCLNDCEKPSVWPGVGLESNKKIRCEHANQIIQSCHSQFFVTVFQTLYKNDRYKFITCLILIVAIIIAVRLLEMYVKYRSLDLHTTLLYPAVALLGFAIDIFTSTI